MQDEPRGEYSLDKASQVRFAALLLAPALAFVAYAMSTLWPLEWWGWAIFLPGFTIPMSPLIFSAVSAVGKLRGNPTLVLSGRGIEIQRGGLWTVLPFLPVPERHVIPWDQIRDVQRLERGVAIDHPDFKPSLIRRLLGASEIRGEVIGLPKLDDGEADPFEAIHTWHEARLLAEVRADRAGSDDRKQVP